MQDLSNKVDGVDTLPADEWNEAAEELVNVITSNGQLPSSGNLSQVLASIVEYGVKGHFYVDSGVDGVAYVLSPSFAGGTIGSYKDGMAFRFDPAQTNTSVNATLNISGLGAKAIVLEGGDPLIIGAIAAGNLIDIIYRSSSDRFEITKGAVIAGSSGSGQQVFNPGVHVFNVPAGGVTRLKFTLIGGGGGGTDDGLSNSGNNGGSGATAVYELADVVGGTAYSITVGAGGAGESSEGAGDNTDGDDTEITAPLSIIAGGGGGADLVVSGIGPGGLASGSYAYASNGFTTVGVIPAPSTFGRIGGGGAGRNSTALNLPNVAEPGGDGIAIVEWW